LKEMNRPDSTHRKKASALKRIPVEGTNLTTDERALLPDPAIVTEDDADFITGHRRRHEKTFSLDDILKRYGVERRPPMER
jgi:hypothetical protein